MSRKVAFFVLLLCGSCWAQKLGDFSVAVETGRATVECQIGGAGGRYGAPIPLSTVTISGGVATMQLRSGSAFYGIWSVGVSRGSGYAVGDTFNVVQGANTSAQLQVLQIGPGGYVKQIGVVSPGSGYTKGTGLTTIDNRGSGSGLTITYLPPDTQSRCKVSGTLSDLDGTYFLLTAGAAGGNPYTFATSSTSEFTEKLKDDAYPSAFGSPRGDGKRWVVYTSGKDDTTLRYVKIKYTTDGVNWVYPASRCPDNMKDAAGNVHPGYNVPGCLMQPDNVAGCHAADHVTPTWCNWDVEAAGVMPDGSLIIPVTEYDYGLATLKLFYFKCEINATEPLISCGSKQQYTGIPVDPATGLPYPKWNWCTSQTGPPIPWFGGMAMTALGGIGTSVNYCNRQHILVSRDNGATWPTVIQLPPLAPYKTTPTAEWSIWAWGKSNACGLVRTSSSSIYPSGPLKMWCSRNVTSPNPSWTIADTNLGGTPAYKPNCTLKISLIISPYCTPSGLGNKILCSYYERQIWGESCGTSGILHAVTFDPDYAAEHPAGFEPQIIWASSSYGKGGGYQAHVPLGNNKWLFMWQMTNKFFDITGSYMPDSSSGKAGNSDTSK